MRAPIPVIQRVALMRVNKDEYLTRAFVLTADDLTKLEKGIEAFAPIRSIKIGCSDKLDREFASVADLVNSRILRVRQ